MVCSTCSLTCPTGAPPSSPAAPCSSANCEVACQINPVMPHMTCCAGCDQCTAATPVQCASSCAGSKIPNCVAQCQSLEQLTCTSLFTCTAGTCATLQTAVNTYIAAGTLTYTDCEMMASSATIVCSTCSISCSGAPPLPPPSSSTPPCYLANDAMWVSIVGYAGTFVGIMFLRTGFGMGEGMTWCHRAVFCALMAVFKLSIASICLAMLVSASNAGCSFSGSKYIFPIINLVFFIKWTLRCHWCRKLSQASEASGATGEVFGRQVQLEVK
jgi:hypothetical protein